MDSTDRDDDFFWHGNRRPDEEREASFLRMRDRGRNEHREHVRSGERGEWCMYCVVLGLVVPDAW